MRHCIVIVDFIAHLYEKLCKAWYCYNSSVFQSVCPSQTLLYCDKTATLINKMSFTEQYPITSVIIELNAVTKFKPAVIIKRL